MVAKKFPSGLKKTTHQEVSEQIRNDCKDNFKKV